MRHVPTLLLMLPALLASVYAQEAKMDPRVAYAPDVVGVDRLFMIAVKAPPAAAQIAVTVPPQVKLLDQTPVPTTADVRRYYFRSQQPGQDIKITFAHPDGPLTVTMTVWSFDDLRAYRKLKNIQLPRRWPLGEALPELKEKQTITTEAQKEAARKSGGGAANWLSTAGTGLGVSGRSSKRTRASTHSAATANAPASNRRRVSRDTLGR